MKRRNIRKLAARRVKPELEPKAEDPAEITSKAVLEAKKHLEQLAAEDKARKARKKELEGFLKRAKTAGAI